jgi:hypothetical protein
MPKVGDTRPGSSRPWSDPNSDPMADIFAMKEGLRDSHSPFNTPQIDAPNLGFSGCRDGMTHLQYITVWSVLNEIEFSRTHDGDCIGSDTQFTQMVNFYFTGKFRVGHPGRGEKINNRYRAFNQYDELREPRDYHERNRTICTESNLLLATPSGPEKNHPRSGTWYTIRHMKRLGRPVIIVMPSGEVEKLNIHD